MTPRPSELALVAGVAYLLNTYARQERTHDWVRVAIGGGSGEQGIAYALSIAFERGAVHHARVLLDAALELLPPGTDARSAVASLGSWLRDHEGSAFEAVEAILARSPGCPRVMLAVDHEAE